MKNIADLPTTEQNNPETLQIDRCDTRRMLELINQEDQSVPTAVAREIDSITKAVDGIVACMCKGGRLIYVGAGTSGRLGVLDASECVPTFGTPPDLVVGIIAGGRRALVEAIEGAEDDERMGIDDIDSYQITRDDAVVGVAASGRTPYVLAAVREAKLRGAYTVGVCNVKDSCLSQIVDAAIEVDTGPEVIMGSTRMKAGTAQKLVLNMLSTSAMIQLGKVYQNYMVDLLATNQKLHSRALRMICTLADVNLETAQKALSEADGRLKVAILSLKTGIGVCEAADLLAKHNGVLRAALESQQGVSSVGY